MRIEYEKCKYRLIKPFSTNVAVFPHANINTKFVRLSRFGELLCSPGFAWNGANIVFDDKLIRASLIHDALYFLIQEKLLDFKFYEAADREFYLVALADGVSRLRAWYLYAGLKIAKGNGATTKSPTYIV